MKVLVFGSVNIDLCFTVDHIAAPGETISSTALVRGAGGKGANQAAALAKAGIPVYLAGKVGSDGQFVLDMLAGYGVNTEQVVRFGGPTGQAIIQLDSQRQNAIVLFSGGNGFVTPEEIAATLANFGSEDWLVVQNEVNCTAEIMRQAKERGMRICLNPSPCTDVIETLPLDLADMLFVNEIEGAFLTGMSGAFEKILDALTARFPLAEIVLTLGKDGAFYGCGKERFFEKAADVTVVDTTGAGDTFSGYFLVSRLKGENPASALHIAGIAAALTVSKKGAMEAIPFAYEVF